MNKKIIIVVTAILVLAGAFIAATRYYKGQEAKKLGFIAQDNYSTFVRDYSPTLGPADAKVTLVEFLDPECEACRFFYSFVKELMAEFSGDLKLVVRYAPFHQNSTFAIKILEAARMQNRYWETLEVLFKYQPEWGSHHNPRPELIWEYLPEADVNIEQIRKDMNDPKITQMIEQDIKDGQALQVRGTPTFFVNGSPLPSFGRQQLRQAIVDALGTQD